MSEALKQKEPTFNNEIRNFDDTTTWLAEVLEGSLAAWVWF